MNRPRVVVTCPRCNGSGFVPRFGYYAKGLCFRCSGTGSITMRAAPDGTADHDHRLAGTYWAPEADRACVLCGLAVEDWSPVVPARWCDGQGWLIYWPGGHNEQMLVAGESRRKAQNVARTAILARLPNARVKWLAA